jgi:hypothetical protein
MRRALLLLAVLAACDDTAAPSLGTGDPTAFRIVRGDDVVYAFDDLGSARDTFRLAAGDSVRVRFRLYDAEGRRVSAAGTTLFVLPGHFDRFHWTPDEDDDFAGSFVVSPTPDEPRSVFLVQLARGDTILLNTGYLPVALGAP